MVQNNQTRELIRKHCEKYPELQLQDIFKFLHQSSFGCEHLLADPSAAVEYIREEAKNCRPHKGEPVEELDGDYCRVHLDYLKEGLSAETFGKLFYLSARPQEDGVKCLEEKLTVLLKMLEEGSLSEAGAMPDKQEAETAITKWRSEGFPALHHSDRFRETYFPAYRVIRKEYALFLPLFAQIDRRLAQGELTLAVEGGSASGKSTLGKLLEQVYGCVVLHMDDFFLRPEQRTAERFAEIGGNVDRERFLEEVLLPLHKKETIAYRKFDCSTFTLQSPVMIESGKLNVIEGAYSCHPDLAGYYDFSVFLDITPKLQKKRILRRNSPQLAERFFNEWIPLEHRYFEGMQVKERCDLVISQGE